MCLHNVNKPGRRILLCNAGLLQTLILPYIEKFFRVSIILTIRPNIAHTVGNKTCHKTLRWTIFPLRNYTLRCSFHAQL